ncbi:SulP family inorganic anion transporter [Bacteroidia bacterium]|nr:SulP family inorganic anion transporter [Bacteroidia bacterium]
MKKYLNLFDFKQKVNYTTEVLSGLTVALALVPEAVAFAFMAGLNPLTGLYAAFSIGLITSIFGGRPGMISGATGAIAIVIVALAKTHGEEYIFATVVLAGIIQMLAGFLKLGKFIRLVPHPVMFGFVNGLAIVIFMSQLDYFKSKGADGLLHWMTGTPQLIMVGLVLLSMLIIWGLPKITKAVPSSLVAILSVFGLVYFLGIDTPNVKDILVQMDNGVTSIKGGFPPFNIPNVEITWDNFILILPYAVIVAAVGLVESLLTLNLIDEITETRGSGNKESVAQGLSNVVTGFFSGMGGCAMIGQSLININNGARARLSGIVASLMLLVFIMFGSSLIEQVPIAALTGLMIMVAIGTFEWVSVRALNKMPMHDIFVMIVVILVTVFMHNLALAVLVGVIISALVFAWESAKRIRARKFIDEDGAKHYEIFGPLFFGSITVFNEKFDVKNDPEVVIIDFKESKIADMSAIEAVNKLTERYSKLGKKVHLRHLSADCRVLLANADKLIDVNIMEDPTYKVAVDV